MCRGGAQKLPDSGKVQSGDVHSGKQILGSGVNAEFVDFVAFYLKYTYRELDLPWIVPIIVICSGMVMLCITLNSFVFSFYWKKVKEVVPMIYTVLSLTDMGVSIGHLLNLICLGLYLSLDMEYKDRGYVYPQMKYSTYIAFFVSGIAIRTSVFLNVILTVVRTITIYNPFRSINRSAIKISLGIFLVFWLVLSYG